MADNTVTIALVAGLALGLSIIALFLFLKKNDSGGVLYTYDDNNRLQSIMPLNQKTQFMHLKQA